MNAHPIATELSQAVLQARILRGELRTPALEINAAHVRSLASLVDRTVPAKFPARPDREEVTRHGA